MPASQSSNALRTVARTLYGTAHGGGCRTKPVRQKLFVNESKQVISHQVKSVARTAPMPADGLLSARHLGGSVGLGHQHNASGLSDSHGDEQDAGSLG